jgi:hypothetical protein
MTGWTALVLAGQRPGVDPLAAHFGVEWKALVEVGGTPMLHRVIRTLLACPEIAQVVVASQRPEVMAVGWPGERTTRPLHRQHRGHLAQHRRSGGHGGGALAGPGHDRGPSAPHPRHGRDLRRRCAGRGRRRRHGRPPHHAGGLSADEAHLAGVPGEAYSGANLFALRTPAARAALDLWAEAEQDRKRALKLFWHFGPLLALRAITRTITAHDALRVAGRRLGIAARLVALPQAEAAIDVDKPADHALAEQILADRTRN